MFLFSVALTRWVFFKLNTKTIFRITGIVMQRVSLPSVQIF